MDGKEQRFREYSTALRSWTIDLSLLDDGELADLEAFFIAQNGSYSSFDFEDPWDGTIYTNCTLDKPEAVFHYIGNQSGSVRLVVQQNRS